ncbi:MAG: 1,3-beta-galactosyl-N-acetylhexosamine phosphorylase [Clostridia bacterium]|nr:1,3-beta-galactosyl-N-acetylhexosamine phosphorylase [Clostridia bacterium]
MSEKIKGRVTIPTDESFVEGTKRIAALWGADAVRDCDGTVLPKNANELAEKVYNTYFIVRGDNDWGRKHPEETHRTFLMSDRVVATGKTLEIDPMKGYFAQQITPDFEEVARWQVFDRTADKEIFDWKADEKRGVVVISNAEEYHEYTVDFMAKIIWHPVQIYNYLTNNWTCEKQLMYDPAYPETAEYIKWHMDEWCVAHPETNVVRFTTFLYQFTLIFNDKGKEKYVDWFGYTLGASPAMLDKFEKEYGYKLTAEDIIDCGRYNNPFCVPTKKFLDYMDFICRFVSSTVKELVDITHAHGKEAMMFLGDDWIGAEPYGKYFKDMGLDAVVGSVGGGVTVRMLSEIPHVRYHEGRFLPYFFPDTFFDGNEENALGELNRNWVTARRAMMRKPLDRMGFGGYLSLADKFPKFISRVTELCDEFRSIISACGDDKPYSGATVAILNAWGSLRSWQSHMVAHELWYQQIYSYQGILEALSGLAVEVKFISFDDIRNKGIDPDIDVIINVGDEGTAFSGGENWNDEKIVAAVRKWVAEGHGFIGIGEPTAYLKGGRDLVLADVLGVDKEKSFTLSDDKYNIEKKAHFITEDVTGEIDYGEGTKNIYALNGTEVLDVKFSDRFIRKVNVGEVMLAANEYGKGRGVYMAGLPYSAQNARLLYRAVFWAKHAEKDMYKAFSSNPLTECTYYPASDRYAVINNSRSEEKTIFYDKDGKAREVTLKANDILWIK